MEPLPPGAYLFMPLAAPPLQIPAVKDRPAFVNRPCYDCLPPATAVFLSPERLKGRRALTKAYIKSYLTPAESLKADYHGRRYAYAYITPADSPRRAEPGAFIRLVFRTLALDLPQTFELRPPQHGADATVRFRTPEHREAALARQPFQLDGATVKLLREGETPNARCATLDHMVHAVLHEYPVELLSREEVEDNCNQFGYVREIGLSSSSSSPDLATVRVILQLEHPREIPHELRIDYADRSTSVVHVKIVRVWHREHSYDAHGQYLRLFQPLHTLQAADA